jgi:iron complex transport system permease protein
MSKIGRQLHVPRWFFVLALALVGAFLFSLTAGSLPLSIGEIWTALSGQSNSPTATAVILEIRLPRTLLAALVGASLGAAGSGFQAVLRNPLADPYVLGVSGGAALGAVSVIVLGVRSGPAVAVAAFFGAITALTVVYLVARAHRGSSHTLILCGVMVGSFASALLLFLLWLTPAESVRTAIFWLAGDLSSTDPSWIPAAAIWSAVALACLWSQSPALDLLTQGEETAADLGLSVGRARLTVLAAAGALTASAVALAGLVGFVGLVIPHVVRLLWGPVHQRLVPAAALLGATFLITADALARVVMAPAEMPVGVVTALLGAPFFLYLLRKQGA